MKKGPSRLSLPCPVALKTCSFVCIRTIIILKKCEIDLNMCRHSVSLSFSFTMYTVYFKLTNFNKVCGGWHQYLYACTSVAVYTE